MGAPVAGSQRFSGTFVQRLHSHAFVTGWDPHLLARCVPLCAQHQATGHCRLACGHRGVHAAILRGSTKERPTYVLDR
jgi:hypothetical protein